ncbi:MAG: hypothetical protein ABSC37_22220 [Xanthobacteraceae bacterium]
MTNGVSNGAAEEQQKRAAEEQGGPKPFSPSWAKEKYKTYSHKAYIRGKEWFQRPWWFQEKEPLPKFTGWVAAFTGVLVVVSALQFCTLRSTDRTTRDALIASSRAWVGPLTTTVNAIQKDKGIEGTVQYQNTGREPASDFLSSFFSKVYSIDEWDNGTAAKEITSAAASCLTISNLPRGLQVIYPNTGFSAYQIHFDTGQGDVPNKIIVTDDMISGKSIFKLQGCFTYKSIREFHHSAFCYFYKANVTTLPNLSICNFGNDAD